MVILFSIDESLLNILELCRAFTKSKLLDCAELSTSGGRTFGYDGKDFKAVKFQKTKLINNQLLYEANDLCYQVCMFPNVNIVGAFADGYRQFFVYPALMSDIRTKSDITQDSQFIPRSFCNFDQGIYHFDGDIRAFMNKAKNALDILGMRKQDYFIIPLESILYRFPESFIGEQRDIPKFVLTLNSYVLDLDLNANSRLFFKSRGYGLNAYSCSFKALRYDQSTQYDKIVEDEFNMTLDRMKKESMKLNSFLANIIAETSISSNGNSVILFSDLQDHQNNKPQTIKRKRRQCIIL